MNIFQISDKPYHKKTRAFTKNEQKQDVTIFQFSKINKGNSMFYIVLKC